MYEICTWIDNYGWEHVDYAMNYFDAMDKFEENCELYAYDEGGDMILIDLETGEVIAEN